MHAAVFAEGIKIGLLDSNIYSRVQGHSTNTSRLKGVRWGWQSVTEGRGTLATCYVTPLWKICIGLNNVYHTR